MDRFEQHGEFSTRGIFSRGARARVSRPFEHAGARLTAAARALRGAPFRAPAAGLMILGATLGTGTSGVTPGDPRSDAFRAPAIERPVPAEPAPVSPAETTENHPIPEESIAVPGDGDRAESEVLEDDVTCVPDPSEPLGAGSAVRVAWFEYLEGSGRGVIYVKDLDGGAPIDFSGGCDTYDPHLRDGINLTYLMAERRGGEHREVVMMADLTTGKHRRLTHRTSLMAFSWDPTGTKLATIDQGTWTDDGEPLGSTIEIVDIRSGDVRTIAIEDTVAGRCGWLNDESALHWSPDGSLIALVMTGFDNAQTLRILDLDGNDLVTPRAGTMARWLDEGRLLYARYAHETMDSGDWLTLDVSTGDETPLDLQPDTFAPALSPNGTRVATFSGDGTLFVHTLANKRERPHEGLVYAHWIDQRHVLASEARACAEGDCYFEFEELGSSAIVDVVTGERTRVDIPSMWGASVWVPPSEQLDAA